MKRELDPLTDVAVQEATTTFRGELFDVETSVKCSEGAFPVLTYAFTTFNKDGEGAKVRLYNDVSILHYRVDKNSPSVAFSYAPYTNQGTVERDDAIAMAKGGAVVVRLLLESGEETIKIDQKDPALRRLLDRCSTLVERFAQRRREEAAQKERDAKDAEEAAAANEVLEETEEAKDINSTEPSGM